MDERGDRDGRTEPEGSGPSASARSLGAVAKRTFKRFQADNASDWAAALTYYSVLSVFPGLLVLVSLLGLFGQQPQTTDSLLRIIGDLGPQSAVDTFRGPIRNLTSAGGAGAVLGIGIVTALWSASGYLGAFTRAANVIYGTEEERPFWKLRPQQIGMTLLLVVLLALLLVSLVVSGPVARSIGNEIGVGDTAVTVWDIVKWPVMIAVVSFMFAMLYHWAPDVERKRVRWISAGSVFAVLAWIVASVAFGFYASHFGSYNATYGSLGGMIVFLLWVWISNNALLFGLELNAELERANAVSSHAERRERPAPDHRLERTAGDPAAG